MYASVVHFIIALGSISAAFGGVLYFEPQSSGTAKDVLCPDGGICRGNATCCMVAFMKYGCCPLPNVSALTAVT